MKLRFGMILGFIVGFAFAWLLQSQRLRETEVELEQAKKKRYGVPEVILSRWREENKREDEARITRLEKR